MEHFVHRSHSSMFAPCFRTECLEQLLGLAPEELTSKTFVDLLQDEDGSATVTMLTMQGWKQQAAWQDEEVAHFTWGQL